MSWATLDVKVGAFGVDTASTISGNDIAKLRQLGYNAFTSRYVSAPFPINQYKVVRNSEVDWHSPGLYNVPLLLNFEQYTRHDSQQGIASWEIAGKGVQDATWAIADLERIGYPHGWPITFSIDDSMRGAAGSADYQRAFTYLLEEMYPTIVKDGRWWPGAYSGGHLFRWLWETGSPRWRAMFKWQAYAWSHVTGGALQYGRVIEQGVHMFQRSGYLNHFEGEGYGLINTYDRNVCTRPIRPWGNGAMPAPGIIPNPVPVPPAPTPQPTPGTDTEETTIMQKLITYTGSSDVFLASDWDPTRNTCLVVVPASASAINAWRPLTGPYPDPTGDNPWGVVVVDAEARANHVRLPFSNDTGGWYSNVTNGAPGQPGPQGPAGVPGRDAVVDYDGVLANLANKILKGLSR